MKPGPEAAKLAAPISGLLATRGRQSRADGQLQAPAPKILILGRASTIGAEKQRPYHSDGGA